MAEAVFPDNTVLCNFAAVRRLDLLEGWLRGRGRWTEAVAEEARRSSRFWPGLERVAADGWMGEPIEIEEPDHIERIEHIRRDVFGGRASDPMAHLGEAQTCFLIADVVEWHGSWWVSDDREALEFARRQGLVTRDTFDIVSAIVADGDLSAQAGLISCRRCGPPGASSGCRRVREICCDSRCPL